MDWERILRYLDSVVAAAGGVLERRDWREDPIGHRARWYLHSLAQANRNSFAQGNHSPRRSTLYETGGWNRVLSAQ